jgi:Acyl-CoA carboxylase epsilon subunit
VSDAPLVLIKGDATPEEVAAVVAVLQAAATSGGSPARRKPSSEWAANHRSQRVTLRHGPGAWRASGLPR